MLLTWSSWEAQKRWTYRAERFCPKGRMSFAVTVVDRMPCITAFYIPAPSPVGKWLDLAVLKSSNRLWMLALSFQMRCTISHIFARAHFLSNKFTAHKSKTKWMNVIGFRVLARAAHKSNEISAQQKILNSYYYFISFFF